MPFLYRNLKNIGFNDPKSPAVYSYVTDDILSDVIAVGYFSDPRAELMSGDVIIANTADGDAILQYSGSATAGLYSSPKANICQVSVTHPNPAYLLPVVGTGFEDLEPPTGYVTALSAFSEAVNNGGLFEVLPDGRVRILKSGYVMITGYADVSHSVNASTVGAAFSIERGATTILTPRAVHSRIPNQGRIGNISGVGSYNAVEGDIVGLALASNLTGDVSIRSASLVFEYKGL